MLLVESVYAPYRETNSPQTFIPSLQHETQMCRVSRYRRLQRHGLLVAVAPGRPTAIMVRCIPVSVTFKMGVASFFDVGSRNRGRLFLLHVRTAQYRGWY